ncbi:MAG: hypothetical protein II995_05980, partial [Oscillospiraceae bacterium]|nr:hypothetical protein [Oscillospiraceae bacterium]
MAKRKYNKYIPKVGGTAVALALTVALSTSVFADDVAATDTSAEDSTPSTDASTEGEGFSDSVDVSETNDAIESSNEETVSENSDTVESNDAIESSNDSVAQGNEEATGGELSDPGMDDLGDAPEMPDTEGMTDEEYNEAVESYNEGVAEYNESVDSYNEGVDEYNAAAGEYEQQAQEEYEAAETANNEHNAGVEEANNDTVSENEGIVSENEETEDSNDNAAAENSEKTEGKFADPGMEDLLNAPEMPDTEGMTDEQYNEAVGGYNEGVAEYNESVDNYNQDVDEYNAAADEYEKQVQAEYEAAEIANNEHNAAVEEANGDTVSENEGIVSENEQTYASNDRVAAENSEKTEGKLADPDLEEPKAPEMPDTTGMTEEEYNKAVEEYNKAVEEYILAAEEYNNAVREYNEAAEEFEKQSEEQHKKDAEQYNKDLAEYQQLVTENEIYEVVSDFNEQVEKDNTEIDKLNNDLENALHANNVESIGDVGEINKNVEVDEGTIAALGGYDDLVEQYNDLQDAAAALENHAGKGADLGTDEYAEYLAAVEAYNEEVKEFNAAVDNYNDAVSAYNAAVEDYNENKEPGETNTSIGDGTGHTDKATDWGNVNTNKDFDHVDVKYQAAASYDVIVGDDGEPDYSSSLTQYTVTGVYADEATYEQQKNSNRPQYSVSYVTEDGASTGIHYVQKDNTNGEFGNSSHSGANVDPVEGKVSFYVTMVDGDGVTHGMTVNLDAGSVYAEGSYYKAESNDHLDEFEDSKGNGLPTKTINGETYYDLNGQSVFLISALTCDGMTSSGGNSWGGGWWGNYPSWGSDSSDEVTLNPDGLDLILNLQTMIEVHQSENANTIGYMSYEQGKTAQAEKPSEPGNPPTEPGDLVKIERMDSMERIEE